MKKISNSIAINAPAEKVWQVLWNDSTRRDWSSAFGRDNILDATAWKEGSRVTVANTRGDGGFGVIEKIIPNKLMRIRELGWIGQGKELPPDYTVTIGDKELKWEAGLGEYQLNEIDGGTRLTIEVELGDDWAPMLDGVFKKAVQRIKQLAENTVVLTVRTTVPVSAEKAWQYFNEPEHITKWNAASPDWHSPRATNDLRVNGKFSYRMEARDGSAGFDFEGVYSAVEPHRHFAYEMSDGRKANVRFTENAGSTTIETSFDAESENPLDLQQTGWQSILDNFRQYVQNQ